MIMYGKYQEAARCENMGEMPALPEKVNPIRQHSDSKRNLDEMQDVRV